MEILHITPHLGGGVGSVIRDWMELVHGTKTKHRVSCLDTINEYSEKWARDINFPLDQPTRAELNAHIQEADVVLLHYWDSDFITDLLSKPLPACRTIFWRHKNIQDFPSIKKMEHDLGYANCVINTSPVQSGNHLYIWSTRNMEKFKGIEKVPHKGFNVGYIGTIRPDKMTPSFPYLCDQVSKKIPDAHFIMVGDGRIDDSLLHDPKAFEWVGHVDDIRPYLARMDVLGYPLSRGHYGTCEQVIGEAITAGVPVVTMQNATECLILGMPLSGDFNDGTYTRLINAFHDPGAEIAQVLYQTAKQRVHLIYNINKMIGSWNEVFEKIVVEREKD